MTRTNKGRAKRDATNNHILPHRRTAKRRRRVTLTEILCRSQQSNPVAASRYRRSADVCTPMDDAHGLFGLHRHLIAQFTRLQMAPQAASALWPAVGRRISGSASTVWRRRECPPIKGLAGTQMHDRRLISSLSEGALIATIAVAFLLHILVATMLQRTTRGANAPPPQGSNFRLRLGPVCDPPFRSRPAACRLARL
jgi:hypothetical protein